MGERSVGAVAAAVALLLAGCGPKDVRDAPTGITIYADPNYRGSSLTLDRDYKDLEDVQGPCVSGGGSYPGDPGTFTWNDCISSIRVPSGWSGTAFGDDDYRGGSMALTGDIPDLRRVPGSCGEGMNDCISSIRVVRP